MRPITSGDVELVPAGAVVLGAVIRAEPASPKTRGRLAFTFHVIQHPDTGSRATIRSSVLAFETAVPQRGSPVPEVQLPRGMDATVTLLAPLLVRIPLSSDGG